MTTSIQQICTNIKDLFQGRLRTPAEKINPLLLVCSALKRPGLSLIVSYGNVMAELSRRGIPTGPLPDGSPNRMAIYTYCVLQEVYRAIKEDMNIQVTFEPGTVNFTGTGYGVVEGVNTNSPTGGGIAT